MCFDLTPSNMDERLNGSLRFDGHLQKVRAFHQEAFEKKTKHVCQRDLGKIFEPCDYIIYTSLGFRNRLISKLFFKNSLPAPLLKNCQASRKECLQPFPKLTGCGHCGGKEGFRNHFGENQS